MLRRLAMQLPEWARPDHPAIRHVLGAPSRQTRRVLFLQLLAGVIILAVAVIAGGIFNSQNVALPLSEIVMNVLFYPVFFLQVLLSVLMIIYTSDTVSQEKRRQVWDTLRTTRSGIGLALRARWSAAVFYRLSGLILVLYVARLILVGLLLYDVTAFGGDYLPIISGGGVTPQLPLVAVIVVQSLSMAASFVLPLTGLGLDAAFGLLLGTLVSQRVFLILAQVIFSVVRIIFPILLLVLMSYNTDITTMPSTAAAWLSMVGYGAFGDWGLRYLNLAAYSELWAMVQFGIFAGVGMLISAFLQALLTDLLVTLAVRRGEVKE